MVACTDTDTDTDTNINADTGTDPYTDSYTRDTYKTLLLGFSQGGAMAIGAGSSLPLAGIIACSAYLHPGFRPPLKTPPVLFTHGTQDSIVPMEASEKLFDLFHHNTSASQIHLFEGGHEIPQKIYGIIRPFIESCLCN